MLLEKINSPEDLKKLSFSDLSPLAAEIRNFLVKSISQTGGHLSSNLGIVELTIMLHYMFDSPKDKIIWDVGHQAYIHKILTGRKEKFPSLRQLNGLSGFPKKCESEHDFFDVGHSSTAVSSAIGIKIAEELQNEHNHIVAVIGDGSFTAGMVFEALNHIGHLNKKVIIILNNNEMSIAKNVGGVSKFLNKNINYPFIAKQVELFDRLMARVPTLGPTLRELTNKFEHGIKSFLLPGLFFQEMGFSYLGPVDGYNLDELRENILLAKKRNKPVIMQVNTIKGFGYEPAVKDPTKYHGTPAFNHITGDIPAKSGLTYTGLFSKVLMNNAEKNKNIIASTAAMVDGTGLKEFAEKYPNRFFDVGIAEQHLVTFSAGLAFKGFLPVTAVYATFLQRAYDQVIHDAALQKLKMIFCIDRNGIVGPDGETHQGIYTISFLRTIPGIKIFTPFSENDFFQIFEKAQSYKCPSFILYPKDKIKSLDNYNDSTFQPVRIFDFNADITIFTYGNMYFEAEQARLQLLEKNIKVNIVQFLQISDINFKLIEKYINESKLCVTLEENVLPCGFGAAILETINDNCNMKINLKRIGIPLEFMEHGSRLELMDIYKVSGKQVANQIIKLAT